MSVQKRSHRAHIDEDNHLITTCVVRIKSKELLAQVLALYEEKPTARCVYHKGKTFVVYHKVTVFFACGKREFSKISH